MAPAVIAVASVVAAYGALKQGQQTATLAERSAALERYQAAGVSQIKTEEAGLTMAEAQHREEQAGVLLTQAGINRDLRKRVAIQAEGTMLAKAGKSGLTVNTGSTRESLADLIWSNAQNIQNQYWQEGEVPAWEKRHEAAVLRSKGAIQLEEAKLGVNVSGYSADTKSLSGEYAQENAGYTGLGDIASGYYKYKILSTGKEAGQLI